MSYEVLHNQKARAGIYCSWQKKSTYRTLKRQSSMLSSHNCDAGFGAVPSNSLHFIFSVPKGITLSKCSVLFLSIPSTTLFTGWECFILLNRKRAGEPILHSEKYLRVQYLIVEMLFRQSVDYFSCKEVYSVNYKFLCWSLKQKTLIHFELNETLNFYRF